MYKLQQKVSKLFLVELSKLNSIHKILVDPVGGTPQKCKNIMTVITDLKVHNFGTNFMLNFCLVIS